MFDQPSISPKLIVLVKFTKLRFVYKIKACNIHMINKHIDQVTIYQQLRE